jgi:hypothetical protein
VLRVRQLRFDERLLVRIRGVKHGERMHERRALPRWVTDSRSWDSTQADQGISVETPGRGPFIDPR